MGTRLRGRSDWGIEALGCSDPRPHGGRCRGGCRGHRDLPGGHRRGGVACVQFLQSAARAYDRGPIRMPRRPTGRGLAVASGAAHPRPRCRAVVLVRVLRGDVGDAAGRHPAVPVRYLSRPAVPHRVPDPASRHRGAEGHDLLRPAAVLPAGVVLDRRSRRGTHRHTRLGDVQAVGDHVDHDRGRARFRVVGQADSLRDSADRGRDHRGHGAGLHPGRAVRGDHLGAAAARPGAGLVGLAGGWGHPARTAGGLP